MQDIDFDEIDRAVSSVTSGDTPVAAPVDAPAQVMPTETPAQPEASPAAKRSSGRFMDVVHPSSDMRPEASAPSRVPAPSAPSFHREEVAPQPESDATRPAPAAVASGAFHWPEPVVDAQPEPVAETAVASAAAAVPIADAVAQALAAEDANPLETPFLTDAKIEKRPLGAFSTKSATPELPLIEEPIPQPVADVEEVEEVPVPEVPQPVDEQPAGPTSITQQYTEKPASETQTTGSIYDTEAYHQPLTNAPKKAGGVMVAVWIGALIVIGGGIGAGIYFIVLPMLG